MAQAPSDEWATIDGLNFPYRDWGGSGRPLVLLPGLASTCHIWDLVAPILAEDHAVIALDLRGHGESDKPNHGYDFATVTQDVLGVIEQLGGDAPVVVGHSWGGSVAPELAVRVPEALNGMAWVDGGMMDTPARHAHVAGARLGRAPRAARVSAPAWSVGLRVSITVRSALSRPETMSVGVARTV